MEKYKNAAGNSGVAYYEAGSDSIIIRFTSGTLYLYDYKRPGKIHVESMKRLAAAGSGLSTYINQYVRDNYARQLE